MEVVCFFKVCLEMIVFFLVFIEWCLARYVWKCNRVFSSFSCFLKRCLVGYVWK